MSTTPVGDWIRKTWPHNPGATHYLGPGDDPGCAAGGHARCTYLAGWREALLSLAAELNRQGNESASAQAMGTEWRFASNALHDAADLARVRAQAGSDGDSGAVPVSPDGGEVQGRSDALRAEAAGRLAYETWQRERGVPGDAHWDAMPAAAQEAWRATAQAVLHADDGAPLPPAVRGWRKNVTCGSCGEQFGTNFAESEIYCPECEARRCPCCGKWFGGIDG